MVAVQVTYFQIQNQNLWLVNSSLLILHTDSDTGQKIA